MPSVVSPYCACAMCQPKSDADIRACHAGLSDEDREDLIKAMTEQAVLFREMAEHDIDPDYWEGEAKKADQARDALVAGRK